MESWDAIVDAARSSEHGRDLLAVLGKLPPVPMWSDRRTGIWHSKRDCRAAVGLVPVSCSITTLPPTRGTCPSCGSLLDTELGRALEVCADALVVAGQPLDWPGLAARRSFAHDPTRHFPVHVRPSPPVLGSTRPVFDAWAAAELRTVDVVAASLDIGVLDRALLANWLLEPDPSEPVEPRDHARLVAWASAATEWTHHDLSTSSTRIDALLTEMLALGRGDVLIVGDVASFPNGRPAHRIVDLYARCAVHRFDTAVVVSLPLAALLFVQQYMSAARVRTSMSAEALRWAVALYESSPRRSLSAALDAAVKLTGPRGRVG